MQRWIAPLNIFLGFLMVAVLALIARDLLGHRLKRLFPVTPPQSNVMLSSTQADLLSFAPILDRGLFGTTTRGHLTPLPMASAVGNKAAPASVPSDLILVGTATGSYRETFALIQKAGTHEERVFRLGDVVFGGGRLAAVKKEQVEILLNGQRVKLVTPLLMGVPSPDNGLSPPHPLSGTTRGLAIAQGAGSYAIDQGALNAALDNIGQVMTDARLLPGISEGKVEGLRVSEVKPRGIFGTVGIKNGDLLQRINDFPIDSPEKAIQAFVTLRGQTHIKLDLVRNGQPTTLSYDIR